MGRRAGRSADVIVRVTRELARLRASRCVSLVVGATFSREEIDMRRMIFTAILLLGNIGRAKAGYIRKTRLF